MRPSETRQALTPTSARGKHEESPATSALGLGFLIAVVIVFLVVYSSETSSSIPQGQAADTPRAAASTPTGGRYMSPGTIEGYTGSVSCAGLQMAPGSGRFVPREILAACRRCNQGDEDACRQVHQYIVGR
ncbi:MAG: hypothetical protein RMM98_14820 [Acidobacteriota bacterium]|nr:hypothetical protein [Blastocatellia bacterium]MDW8240880.1 hypothetical protein [Acidobacteriota bacterium]